MNKSPGTKMNPRSYTVEEVISKMGFGPFQILVSIFCGVLCLADAMELMILSILSPAVKCQWSLSGFEEALITSIVFFGFFLGGLFWGVVFDIIGRKKGLLLVNIILLVFGVLSALKVSAEDSRLPGYPWLLVCRFGVGFGAGGAGQSVTYYVEFLPHKTRGICVVLISVWWSVGTIFGALLAVGVMREDGLGWHWYLGLAAVPLALTLFLFPVMPESARFYLVQGQDEQAQKVMEKVARYNCKKLPPGKVVLNDESEQLEASVSYNEEIVAVVGPHTTATSDLEEDSTPELHHSTKINSQIEAAPLLDESETNSAVEPKASKSRNTLAKSALLFSNGMWRTTVILLFLWFGVAWLYYGVVLLTTSLLQYNPHCGIDGSFQFSNSTNQSEYVCEGNQLNTEDYLKIMWTSAAELPGILITLTIIELLGRKVTIAVECLATMIGFLLLFMCTSDILTTFFLFLTRAFISGVFQVVYVYTPEVYSTSVRTLGMGVCTAAARIGAIITPYVAQVLLRESNYATLSLYAGSSLGMAVLAMLLPIETKGKALQDKGTMK